jgi:hypothetical protein
MYIYTGLSKNSDQLSRGYNVKLFSALVQIGPVAHPASYALDTGALFTHFHLAPRLKKE